jgi:FtsH-binding integral membrane protein
MGVHFMLKQPHDGKQNQWWLVLLLAPFVGVLWVPFFNAIEPKLWGIPFFFWYQFLWVVISAIVTALVYFKVAPKPLAIRQDHRESRRQ